MGKTADFAKVTSKGQVTVPRRIRELLNVETGDRLMFSTNDRGEVVVSKADFEAFTQLQDLLSSALANNKVTEADVLAELRRIREERRANV